MTHPNQPTSIREKYCGKCGSLKPSSDFHKNNQRKDGLTYMCKTCTKKVSQKWYWSNRERNLAYCREYNRTHPEIRQANNKRNANPFKNKARHAVNNAILAGKFFKEPCQECGESKADFHHTNGYDEPNWFTGVWLCRQHHADIHRRLRWQTA